MLARGSLPRCIDAMARELSRAEHLYLSIVHNPKGRYYTLLTEAELMAIAPGDDDGHNRLVLRLTWRELRQLSLCLSSQLDAFGGRDAE